MKTRKTIQFSQLTIALVAIFIFAFLFSKSSVATIESVATISNAATIASAATISTNVLDADLNEYTEAKNFVEQNGVLVIEAEHFVSQHKDNVRRWIVFPNDSQTHLYQDSDSPHVTDASNGQYIEILPDTRSNHFETLVRGENFSNVPGQVAVLSYPSYFETPGVYYVWARAYSTGSEDNGIHIGLNGQWPESAQRLQLCQGKHQWTWSSAQRVADNHCGTAQTITLNVPSQGVHNIMISMREDGFELDKLILTQDKSIIPTGQSLPETRTTQTALKLKTQLLDITNYARVFWAVKDFFIAEHEQMSMYPIEELNALGLRVEAKDVDNRHTVKTESKQTYAFAHVNINRRDAGLRDISLVSLSSSKNAASFKIMLNDKKIAHFTAQQASKDNVEQVFTVKQIALSEGDRLSVGVKGVGIKGAEIEGAGIKGVGAKSTDPNSLSANTATNKTTEHTNLVRWRALVLARSTK